MKPQVLLPLKTLIISILTSILLIFYLPVSLVLFLSYRKLVQTLARIFQSDLGEIISGMEVVLTFGKDLLTLNVLVMYVVDGIIDEERIRKDLEEHILTVKKTADGTLAYQKLKMYWKNFLGYPFWKDERNFQAKDHIRKYDYEGLLSLPPAPSREDLRQIAGRLLYAPWKPYQSPWEILLIKNYKGLSQTVIMVRTDHLLGDGQTGLEFFWLLSNTKIESPQFKLANRRYTRWERLGLVCRMPLDMPKILFPKNLPVRNWMKNKVDIVLTPEIRVELIKSIKNFYKVQYSTVIASAISAAISRGLEQSGVEILGKEYTAAIPFPKPHHPGGLINHTYVTLVNLPLDATSAQERLERCQDALKSAGKSSIHVIQDAMGKLPGIFPTKFARLPLKLGMENQSVTISILPVTVSQESYNGLPLLESIANMGNCWNTSLNVMAYGTGNQQTVSFCVNKGVFASEEITSNLAQTFVQEIETLAKKTM